MKKLIIFVIIATVFCLPLCGWSKTILQHKVVYESRHDHVFIMYESDGNDNVVAQNFEHPVQLTAEEVSRILGQLRYSKSFFFDWRGNHAIFFESELEKLSGQISRALQDASSNEWVSFASTVQSRDAIDPVPLFTDGYILKKDGKLHVVLLNLKFEISKEDRPRPGDPRERFSLPFKRINTTEEMSAPPVDPGLRFLGKPHDNWVVIDFAALLNPEKQTSAKPKEPAKIEKKSLVDRMKTLKELFDNDLITKEEYEKKKEELLDEI